MVTTTTTYSFKKPTVGDDEDVWGGYLNDSMDLIDDVLDGTTPVTGIDINSGTIDNAVIGGTTPVAGTFTTLTANTSFGVTGNITVSGTVDGVDIATRDAVLTSTTTTANAALPKAGGTMTGAITFATGQTFDGRDVSADGAKLDGIESGATADQTASEILTAIKTVDGSGSGLDADTLDGVQGSSFLRSDTNDSISNPFNLDFSTSNTSNYIPADNTTALAVAPFSALAWHDVFAFNRYYSASQEEWNGSSWSSTTLDDALFAQKENQAITVASGSTITKVRWNFTGTSWIQPAWLVIGFTYVAGGASKTVTVESSSDGGSTWTTRHTSTTTSVGKVVHFKLNDWSGDADVRVTIDRNDTNDLKMSYMSLLTARSGDQGKGKEAQVPFSWDSSKNITLEGTLNGGTPWTTSNDGSGSGLDADLLDGVHGSSFLRSDTGSDFSGTLNYTPDTGTILSVDGQAILQRMTANGAITIGHDDAVIIAGGDTSVTLNANISNSTETVFVGAEGGLVAYAFPNNDTSWSNRKELNWNGTNLTLNSERVITTGDATQDYGLITGSVTLTNDYGALS